MAYRIYSNHANGGPVDYSAPLATVTALSCVCGPLPVSSDSTFVVHAFDQVSLKEEANTDARIRLRLDSQGQDISDQPAVVDSLTVVPSLGGGGRVSWTFVSAIGAVSPSTFTLNLYDGQTIVASANLPFQPGQIAYSHVFPGPLSPAVYTAGVSVSSSGGLTSPLTVASSMLGLSSSAFVIDSLYIH